MERAENMPEGEPGEAQSQLGWGVCVILRDRMTTQDTRGHRLHSEQVSAELF